MGKYFKVRKSKWSNDFRATNPQDSSEYGVCYKETKQSWTTLNRHESEQSIIDTNIHEMIHQGIAEDVVGEDMDESLNMNTEQEHEMIKRVIWCLNDWVDFE